MKYIFLNLKRFDIQPEHGGINTLAPIRAWASRIAVSLDAGLVARKWLHGACTFAAFFPEAHILPAAAALRPEGIDPSHPIGPLGIGCQSVLHADTSPGGNFGAFTSFRTANAARELGCTWTMIGHSEERRYTAEIMAMAGAGPDQIDPALNRLFNLRIACALKARLKVLYCIGEKAEEVPARTAVLKRQVEGGLAGIDTGDIVLAYEPVWAIGPGKTPPAAEEIASIASAIKSIVPLPLVYGGGLKKENARSIGGIADLDGGLVALTRFSGAIGFHPGDFLEIVDTYFEGCAPERPRGGVA